MRCFSDGTATTARKWGKLPANKNLTPKKWEFQKKRDSMTGLIVIQSAAAVYPRLMEKSGKWRKGLPLESIGKSKIHAR